MNLFEVLSKDIEQDRAFKTTTKHSKKAILTESLEVDASTLTKPILQLNALPMTINPDEFKNAYSSENPKGSLSSLWAFRQLVSPMPTFSKYYNPSNRSTESVYASIVKGASTSVDSPFITQIIADSKQSLELTKYANMDDTPGAWAPIQATPSDWYDTSNNRYKSIEFDLSKAGNPDSRFAIIGGKEASGKLQFSNNKKQIKTKNLDITTEIKKISMKYLEVSLSREWYNETLFSTYGWLLKGQPKGFCSSGDLDANDGIFSIVPSSIILGCNLSVDANWSESDQKHINDSVSKGEQVSIDNLVIHPEKGKTDLQVIGWVSKLIPFSPK
ncbi:MAG: hypothetical protein COB15_11645 [Flavobacteriales bacterium]|nr:MAG: hypothetical protein COB15_11645 [Flavobacteriales bacterium]